MGVISIPVKTPEALAELASRRRKLSQRHRTVLLLVDGRRAEDEVRQLAQAAGSPSTCFDELLDLGMISRPTPLDALPMAALPATAPQPEMWQAPKRQEHLAEDEADTPDGPDSVTSLLPASASLHPESNLDALIDLPGAAAMDALDDESYDDADPALEEARAILLRAVRAEAPVAGSLTLLRLRRARSREDLESLLEEVELRIFKPFKGLWASQTMARVRELLASPPPISIPYP